MTQKKSRTFTSTIHAYLFRLAVMRHGLLNTYIDGVVIEDYEDYCILASKQNTYKVIKLEKAKLELGKMYAFLCKIESKAIGLEFVVTIKGLMATPKDFLGSHNPFYVRKRYLKFLKENFQFHEDNQQSPT